MNRKGKEDIIAQMAWEQYSKDNDAEAFFENVSYIAFPLGFRLPYNKALVFHKTKRDKEASEQIDLAVRNFEGLLRNNRCANCKTACGNYLYRLGSIINHTLNNKEKTAEYNIKLSQYDPMTSDYDGKDYVDVFSFRRYNQYSIQDLINNEITVVFPSEMNDPFDSVYNVFREIDNLESICYEKDDALGYHDIFNYYRVRSFVKGNSIWNLKNILMWSHYTDGHKGFCIKYRLSKHFINTPTDNGYLCMNDIRYTSQPIPVNCDVNGVTAFMTKNSRWQYEHEVRLISYDVSTESPYFAHPLDKDSFVSAIYFGYKCDEKVKDTIYNMVKSKYPKCSFWQMGIDKSKNVYELKASVYKEGMQ